MKIPTLLFPALFVAAVIAGCDNQTTEPADPGVFVGVDDEHFYQDWTRSPEDEIGLENPSDWVFRPSGSNTVYYPGFLHRYIVEQDGTCQWLVRGPADMQFMENGTWKVEPGNLNVVAIDNPIGIEVAQFRVLELDVDYMRVEAIKYEVPRCNYRYGVVDASFGTDATFDQVDTLCRDLGLDYMYLRRGQVHARIEVVTGEVAALIAQLEAEDAVEEITYGQRWNPAPHDILYITFVVGVATESASDYLATIPGIEIEEVRKWAALVRFEVTPGSENDWIEVIGQQPIVSSCRKVNEDRSPGCVESSS